MPGGIAGYGNGGVRTLMWGLDSVYRARTGGCGMVTMFWRSARTSSKFCVVLGLRMSFSWLSRYMLLITVITSGLGWLGEDTTCRTSWRWRWWHHTKWQRWYYHTERQWGNVTTQNDSEVMSPHKTTVRWWHHTKWQRWYYHTERQWGNVTKKNDNGNIKLR